MKPSKHMQVKKVLCDIDRISWRPCSLLQCSKLNSRGVRVEATSSQLRSHLTEDNLSMELALCTVIVMLKHESNKHRLLERHCSLKHRFYSTEQHGVPSTNKPRKSEPEHLQNHTFKELSSAYKHYENKCSPLVTSPYPWCLWWTTMTYTLIGAIETDLKEQLSPNKKNNTSIWSLWEWAIYTAGHAQ